MTREKTIKLLNELSSAMKGGKKSKPLVFKDVVVIPHGRVPVLKCKHVALHRELNLNFTSHTGVNNSFLIKHLISLDSRIRPMMVLLKLYFKLKLPENSMTTFNLYCLVIFALQNLKQPVLPPLSTFLKGNDPKEKTQVLFEKRWPVQFLCKDFTTENKSSLFDLVLDFCSFYAEFDFANRVISPYMGNRQPAVTRANYDTFEEFKCSEHTFNFDRVINVQDFFVLCVNLGTNCVEFQSICAMHHEQRDFYRETQSDDDGLFKAFFVMK